MTGLSDRRAEGVFEPREIADLREIFYEVCHHTRTAPDTEAGQMLAKRLLAATRCGVKDRAMLLRLAGTAIGGNKGGRLTSLHSQ